MSRTHRVLAAAALVQAALVVWSWAPRASPEVEPTVLVPWSVEEVDGLDVASGEQRVSLRRSEGQWRLESLDLHDKAGNRRHHQFIELLVFSADEY